MKSKENVKPKGVKVCVAPHPVDCKSCGWNATLQMYVCDHAVCDNCQFKATAEIVVHNG